jgi:preprotein translocase subunit SecE
MNNGLIIGFIVLAVIFGILWKNGQLLRLNTYVGETKEELRKCTWPTKEELKGSTLVVIISVAALAAFTVVVDFVVHNLVTFINH